jgi:hypothetical protein
VGIEGTSLRVGEPARTREPSHSSADAIDPLPTAHDAATRVDLGLAALFRHSSAARPALRIGVVLDGGWTTRCFRAVLEDVAGSDFARLCAVVYDARVNEPAPSGWRRVWRALARRDAGRPAAPSLYTRLVDRPDPAQDPLAAVPCVDLLDDVKTFTLPLDDAAAVLRDLELDVLLLFGTRPLPDSLAGYARYGAWRYEHGLVDPCADGSGAPLRALAEHDPVSSVCLRAAAGGAPVTLCRGEFPTSRTLSVSENRHAPFWGTQHFVIQKLNELHRYGWDRLVERARVDEAALVAAAQDGRPMRGWRAPTARHRATECSPAGRRANSRGERRGASSARTRSPTGSWACGARPRR